MTDSCSSAPPTYEQAVATEPPTYDEVTAAVDGGLSDGEDHKHETPASTSSKDDDKVTKPAKPAVDFTDWRQRDKWLARRQRQVDAIKSKPLDWTALAAKCVKMQDTNDSPNGRASALDRVLTDRHDLLPVTKEPVESDWSDFIGLTTSFNHLVLHVDTLRLAVPDEFMPPISAALANWRMALRIPGGLDEKQLALLERDGHVKCNNVQSFQMVWENDKDRLAWIKSVYILGGSYVVYGGQAKRAGKSSNGSRLVRVRNPYFLQLPAEPTA